MPETSRSTCVSSAIEAVRARNAVPLTGRLAGQTSERNTNPGVNCCPTGVWSASLIMFVVFGAFVISPDAVIKSIGWRSRSAYSSRRSLSA